MANRLRLKKNNIASFVDSFYPVGAVYISFDSTNPSNFFGDTWERIRSRFLLAADEDKYIVNRIGGEETHALNINEMPRHNHKLLWENTSPVSLSSYSATVSGYSTGCGSAQVNPDKFATGFVGEGNTHNNMPPYITVYMWKRVS